MNFNSEIVVPGLENVTFVPENLLDNSFIRDQALAPLIAKVGEMERLILVDSNHIPHFYTVISEFDIADTWSWVYLLSWLQLICMLYSCYMIFMKIIFYIVFGIKAAGALKIAKPFDFFDIGDPFSWWVDDYIIKYLPDSLFIKWCRFSDNVHYYSGHTVRACIESAWLNNQSITYLCKTLSIILKEMQICFEDNRREDAYCYFFANFHLFYDFFARLVIILVGLICGSIMLLIGYWIGDEPEYEAEKVRRFYVKTAEDWELCKIHETHNMYSDYINFPVPGAKNGMSESIVYVPRCPNMVSALGFICPNGIPYFIIEDHFRVTPLMPEVCFDHWFDLLYDFIGYRCFEEYLWLENDPYRKDIRIERVSKPFFGSTRLISLYKGREWTPVRYGLIVYFIFIEYSWEKAYWLWHKNEEEFQKISKLKPKKIFNVYFIWFSQFFTIGLLFSTSIFLIAKMILSFDIVYTFLLVESTKIFTFVFFSLMVAFSFLHIIPHVNFIIKDYVSGNVGRFFINCWLILFVIVLIFIKFF